MDMEDTRVLVVDDNANMRRLIASILRSMNMRHVTEAASASEALDILKRRKVDVALVDYVMDGGDGVALTRSVRQEIDRRKPLPIIMLTGYDDEVRRRMARDAGADEVISKPFSTRTLMQSMARVMAARSAGTA
jgi:CheY-like chemotaxis protein